MSSRNETTRQLRVTLTDKERLELGRQLAQASQQLETIAENKKAANAQFAADKAAADSKITAYSQQLSTGYRMDSVKCVWLMDSPEAGKKQLIRDDTKEVIETDMMTDAEKQTDLPLADPDGGETVKTTVDSNPESGVVTVDADKGSEADKK